MLSDNCFQCHGPDESARKANLRLDLREGALAARRNGAPIVPGKPEQSLLYKRITEENPARRMPPVSTHKTLTDEQKARIKLWIEQGADWKQHWAFVTPKRPALPSVKDQKWARTAIDRFVLAKIEQAGLTPNAEADRRALIRRVSLDLTGLPPDPDAVSAFVADTSPDAYAKVVARLLASPHYGEHRARYWLDAARYGDTNGLHYDNYRGGIWPYRDWVVRAFNSNLPFDRFTVEQLAGDLLPNPTLDQLHCDRVRAQQHDDQREWRHRRRSPRSIRQGSSRYGRYGVPRADRRVCHLPRSQVRSDLRRRTTTRSKRSSTTRPSV